MENLSFKEIRMTAGYSIDDCIKRFKVCKRTVLNWDSGKNKPPQAVFLCLSIYAGQLDFLGKAWSGFRILPDCIVSPNNEHLWHYEIRALNYVYKAAGLERYRICRILKQSNEVVNVVESSKVCRFTSISTKKGSSI